MQNTSISPLEALHRSVGLGVIICLSAELFFELLSFLQYPLRIIPYFENDFIAYLIYFIRISVGCLLPVILAMRTSNIGIKITTMVLAGLVWLVFVGGKIWDLLSPPDFTYSNF